MAAADQPSAWNRRARRSVSLDVDQEQTARRQCLTDPRRRRPPSPNRGLDYDAGLRDGRADARNDTG
ncbi:hypothetical protein H7J88_26385 [Mycolicibacterium flavescens]|uniref:hypothetical protein n=1 Tax=Mycolicibacterium flavescens TaxID=1776 RepID=UPI0010427526|nr:hypothetical protein [Mycolicibacterium flavescens]MCV7283168.1 hypothetical protein [Mycolicibacterium flavescens]